MIKTTLLCLLAFSFGVSRSIEPPAYMHRMTVRSDAAGLKKGEKCPDFVFKDTAGRDVKLSQFKGKYIYIDVWASWCYPCRKEYPELVAMRDRMKDKNIVFVGISTDTKEYRWKGTLQNLKMEGVHWMLKDTGFTKSFNIPSIPRYILIDTKGIIINPAMSGPSDPETERTLNNLKNR